MNQAYLKIYHPQNPILNCEKNLSTILYYVIYFVYLCKLNDYLLICKLLIYLWLQNSLQTKQVILYLKK